MSVLQHLLVREKSCIYSAGIELLSKQKDAKIIAIYPLKALVVNRMKTGIKR